jgi:hypothetical protein
VASLLAAGRSNRDIAQLLVISEGTVEVHVKHILSKLGVKSRGQVAAWANEHGLSTTTQASHRWLSALRISNITVTRVPAQADDQHLLDQITPKKLRPARYGA